MSQPTPVKSTAPAAIVTIWLVGVRSNQRLTMSTVAPAGMPVPQESLFGLALLHYLSDASG